MSNGGRFGVATAVALAGGVGDALSPDAEQQTLFDDCDDDPSVPALPLPTPVPNPSRPGRRVGSRNRSTEQVRQLFLSRYPSPLMGLGAMYSMSVEDLARQLGLYKTVDLIEIDPETGKATRTKVEDRSLLDLERAFRFQLEARQAALPYIHQKQPLAIEQKSSKRGLVVINDQAAGTVADVSDFDLALAGDTAVDVTPQHAAPAAPAKPDPEPSP